MFLLLPEQQLKIITQCCPGLVIIIGTISLTIMRSLIIGIIHYCNQSKGEKKEELLFSPIQGKTFLHLTTEACHPSSAFLRKFENPPDYCRTLLPPLENERKGKEKLMRMKLERSTNSVSRYKIFLGKNYIYIYYKNFPKGLSSLGNPSKFPEFTSACSIGLSPIFQMVPSAGCSLLGVSITKFGSALW